MLNFLKNKNNKSKKIKTKLPNLKKGYLMTLTFFSIGLLFLIISPTFTGESFDYERSEVGDVRSLSNNLPLELVRKEWNPDSGLLRLDYEIEATINTATLSNIDYYFHNRYASDPTDALEYEYIRVNPRYFVLLVKNVPQGFQVLGTGIDPTFIEPDIESDTNMEERTIQYFFYEEDMVHNEELIEQSLNHYQVSWLELQKKDLSHTIEDNNELIRLSKVRIGNIEKSIQESNSDTTFMTDTEIEKMEDDLIELENDITQEEVNIQQLEEENLALNERISLYKQQIKSIEQSQSDEE